MRLAIHLLRVKVSVVYTGTYFGTWVTSLNFCCALIKPRVLTATNVLLHDRPVAREVLMQVCGNPEVDCSDVFSAVAGIFLHTIFLIPNNILC